MPVSPALNHPWPEKTPAPSFGQPHASTSKLVSRQIVTDQSAVATAKQVCEVTSGNEVLSCFPTADDVFPQHQWATFVWNSNNPDFVQTERVDVYLFHGDSLQQVLAMPNQVNPQHQAGSITAQVDDRWRGDRGANWAGKNISYPFYWLIARAGESLTDGTLKPQTTFSAVQTTFADSVLASMSSASASATSHTSATSLISGSSSAIVTTINGTLTTLSPTGSLQQPNSGTGGAPFPTWAIVLIVVGIIAVIAICGCMLFIIHCIRQRDREDRNGRRPIPSPPNMVEQDDAPPPVAAAVLAQRASITSHGHAQTASRTTSPAERTTSPDSTGSRAEQRPFSQSDAAVMATAFRTAMRQPGRPLAEDEGSMSPATEREALLQRELGDEGTDIWRVGSARGVRVESSSEDHEFAARSSSL